MEKALIVLTGTLVLALFVERLLETLKALYDVWEVKSGRYKHWENLANRIADQLHSRISRQEENNKFENFHLKLVSQYLFSTSPDYQGSLLVSADKVRTIFMKYIAKLASILLGLVLVAFTDINVFVLVQESAPKSETLPSLFQSPWLTGGLGVFITGVAIGLGAGPMHKFIVALERARKKRKPTGLV